MDLHKWPVVETACKYLERAYATPLKARESGDNPDEDEKKEAPFPLRDYNTPSIKIVVSAEDLIEGAAGPDYGNDYIKKLKPVVEKFAADHKDHNLFLVCDMGQEPWDWPYPEWDEWREVPGAFNFKITLPRNMIELGGITSWEEAQEKYKDEWPFDFGSEEEIEELREAFEKRLKERG